MIGANERRTLLERLRDTARLREGRLLGDTALRAAPLSAHHVVAAVEGHVEVGGCDMLLRVGVCHRFPLVLPHVFVVTPELFATIPHVESDGRICYRGREGLLLDTDAPRAILEEAFDAAIETLRRGVSGENWIDFVDEIEAYWREGPCARPVPCYVTPDETLRPIVLSYQDRHYLHVFDAPEQISQFTNRPLPKQAQHWQALYVPLSKTAHRDRFTPRAFDSPSWVNDFVWRNLTPENAALLRRLTVKDRRRAFVVLGVPRTDEGMGLVGLDYLELPGRHPLAGGVAPKPAIRVSLARRDRAHVTVRGGGDISLARRHVVLAGCGAVGGYVAHALAHAGVGRLTLVDPDTLGVQNAYRHVLGKTAVGKRKVDALRDDLLAKIPYLRVDVAKDYIEAVLADGTFDAREADLLVYAAGEPTIGLHVNRLLHERSRPALVLTWVEPYGIGGHAMLTNTGREGARGCFGCLFAPPKEDRAQGLRNRSDFAARSQTFSKALSGCATTYTPYADLEARRTAELAARLAIRFLAGQSEGHPLLSFKGDDAALTAAGFRTSQRYALPEGDLHQARFSYVRGDCTVCGGGT